MKNFTRRLLAVGAVVCAGCNESTLEAAGGAPGPGGGPLPVDGEKPVAVILVSGGGSAVTFDGSSSYDPDDATPGAIVAFAWALTAQPAGSAATLAPGGSSAVLAADLPGSYTLSLVVEDREGLVSDAALYTLAWLTISIDGDCVSASCPAEAPYPAACDIQMDGGDERGCVASSPMTSTVYFQEGDVCGAGHVSGTLLCAATPGLALDSASCPMNKSVTFYPPTSDGCPETD